VILIGAIIVLARSPLLQGDDARPSDAVTTDERAGDRPRVVS
jgi:hypothetical protein